MVLLISYDLMSHERPSSYAAVKNYIEKHAESAIRPLYSQWFVQTSYTPDAWVQALRDNELIDNDDQLFICQVKWPYQGWLAQHHWDWLNPRV